MCRVLHLHMRALAERMTDYLLLATWLPNRIPEPGAQEVCGWINEKANRPVWAKMTPNITDITNPARTALAAGCEGVAAINTITSGALPFKP